jgi:hypothetical protein
MSASARATAEAVRGRARSLLEGWFREIRGAKKAHTRVALATGSAAPVEVLRAAGILPLLPPVTSLALPPTTRPAGAPLIGCDSCAPLREDERLLEGLALEPDLVVSTNAECHEQVRWLELVAARSGARLVLLDVPDGGQGKEDVLYVTRQLEGLVRACEGVTGARLDPSRLEAAVRSGARAEAAWLRIQALGRSAPVPFDAYFDLIDLVGALACLRGTDDVVSVLEASGEAYSVLASASEGPLVEERFRLIVEGPPPQPGSARLREALERRGAVAVLASYSCFPGVGADPREDPGAPLEAVARRMLRERHAAHGLLDTPERLGPMLETWRADGVLRLAMRTCELAAAHGHFTGPPLDAPLQVLASDFGVTGLGADAEKQLDGFLEKLLERRGRPR